ncbi:uncharacterized protein LOC125497545 isoform X2 [Beta vulgaris subsp. vulgaris]|uniref:uncharacterized protein LOC125497545 isoform X2 n=1 Tax=Beta vulgaris subsp. vulgaris TaxID=3555 RepID=UPI002036B72E|nr:uncharacterized protein LOC125497545 isoform X2 [Beta vulgaris subsp. vulgaris]
MILRFHIGWLFMKDKAKCLWVSFNDDVSNVLVQVQRSQAEALGKAVLLITKQRAAGSLLKLQFTPIFENLQNEAGKANQKAMVAWKKAMEAPTFSGVFQ